MIDLRLENIVKANLGYNCKHLFIDAPRKSGKSTIAQYLTLGFLRRGKKVLLLTTTNLEQTVKYTGEYNNALRSKQLEIDNRFGINVLLGVSYDIIIVDEPMNFKGFGEPPMSLCDIITHCKSSYILGTLSTGYFEILPGSGQYFCNSIV